MQLLGWGVRLTGLQAAGRGTSWRQRRPLQQPRLLLPSPRGPPETHAWLKLAARAAWAAPAAAPAAGWRTPAAAAPRGFASRCRLASPWCPRRRRGCPAAQPLPAARRALAPGCPPGCARCWPLQQQLPGRSPGHPPGTSGGVVAELAAARPPRPGPRAWRTKGAWRGRGGLQCMQCAIWVPRGMQQARRAALPRCQIRDCTLTSSSQRHPRP